MSDKNQNDPSDDITANALNEVVHPSWSNPDGAAYTITALDVAGANIRQAVKRIMLAHRPDVVANYKAMKNANRVPGKCAPLADHQAATIYLFTEFVKATHVVPGL